MISCEIRENGSTHHPYYLRVYVDNKLVKEKSFMSIKLAEKGKESFLLEIIEQYVKDMRKAAKAFDSSEISKYVEVPFDGNFMRGYE